MKRRLLLLAITSLFLLSFVLTGCESGIAQETYDKLKAQYEEIAGKYQEVAGEVEDIAKDLEDEKDALESELEDARSKVSELEGLVDTLREQYELIGDTPAETAEKIVKYYHDTHIYDAVDLFVCADMAAEVWNMLKAQGIDALMVVGNVNNAITDIILCNHSWVLAEVAPGEYLALETTGGRVVYSNENPLYYQGWYFTSPADQKNYQYLVKEYNTRVSIRNEIAHEVSDAADYYNQSSNQAEADQRLPVYEKLLEIQQSMEAELNSIKAEIDSLAKKL
jgi:predicted  nucleic acid-binding Zn-ribbon protein